MNERESVWETIERLGILTPFQIERGRKVIPHGDSQDVGFTTGGTRRCGLDGCGGTRFGVRWNDGKITYPCTDGCRIGDDLIIIGRGI